MFGNSYMTADVCCYITVLKCLTLYNCYQTSDIRHQTSDDNYIK